MAVRHRAEAGLALAAGLIVLTGCTATDRAPTAQPLTAFGHGVLATEHDLGDASDLRAVRLATVAALSDEVRAFAVDPGLREQQPPDALAALLATGPTEERAALLGRAHSPRLAEDLEQSFVFFARQDFGAAWTGSGSRAAWLDRDVWASGRFHVDHWQGVRVVGDTARVLVRGEDRGTSWGGALTRDAWRQEQLILRRDPSAAHGWRIVRHKAASTAA